MKITKDERYIVIEEHDEFIDKRKERFYKENRFGNIQYFEKYSKKDKYKRGNVTKKETIHYKEIYYPLKKLYYLYGAIKDRKYAGGSLQVKKKEIENIELYPPQKYIFKILYKLEISPKPSNLSSNKDIQICYTDYYDEKIKKDIKIDIFITNCNRNKLIPINIDIKIKVSYINEEKIKIFKHEINELKSIRLKFRNLPIETEGNIEKIINSINKLLENFEIIRKEVRRYYDTRKKTI